jgi:predicted alpha/beta-hydrolase family hydrolase
VRAKEVGGEAKLLTLILGALKWQSADWATDGWKFAPYFERYLKRRKWEDEPPPAPQAVPRPIDRSAERTDRKIAEYRAAQGKPLTKEQLEDIKRRNVG